MPPAPQASFPPPPPGGPVGPDFQPVPPQAPYAQGTKQPNLSEEKGSVVFVFKDDMDLCMEEKRALGEKYRYDPMTLMGEVNKLNDSIQARLAQLSR